jgi:hypothetical protein
MLHIKIRDRITNPEVRLMYDSKMALSHPTIKTEVINTIKKLRQKYNSHASRYLLGDKLEMHGNDGGWYVSKVKEFVKAMYQGKNPPMENLGRWRSIEFELIFKSKKDCEDFALLARQNGMAKLVTIKVDGSLRVEKENEQANEVVLSYRAGDEKIVQDFCQLLRGRAYVNKTCGTHVHFDFRHVGIEEANLYGKRLERCVPALRLLLPNARRNSEYCKEDINNYANAAGGGGHDRYAFINMFSYAKYKTIEIRGHSGTINADKILNWIKLCEIIMATELNFTGNPDHRNKVSKIEDLIVQYADQLDAGMVQYIKNRYETFKTATTDEAENKFLALDVPPLPMFNPPPKKKVEAKKPKKKKRKAEAAVLVGAPPIPPPINAMPEVVAAG